MNHDVKLRIDIFHETIKYAEAICDIMFNNMFENHIFTAKPVKITNFALCT